jgi:hypothetical protein
MTARGSFPLALAIAALQVLFAPIKGMAADSPCCGSIAFLKTRYSTDPNTRRAFDKVYAGLTDLPKGYSCGHSSRNPWKAARDGAGMHRKMMELFEQWCTALPAIEGNSDNALDPILGNGVVPRPLTDRLEHPSVLGPEQHEQWK